MKKRAKILQCAAREFLRSGFSATTIDQIAAESGVVKQTVYNYFETKHKLFAAAVDHLMSCAAIHYNDIWLNDEPEVFFEKVAQQLLANLRTTELVSLLKLAVKETHNFPELQEAYARSIPQPMIEFIAAYAKKRVAMSDEPARLFAWCFRSALTGYSTTAVLSQLMKEPIPQPAQFVRELSKLFTFIMGSWQESMQWSKDASFNVNLYDAETSYDGLREFLPFETIEQYGDKGLAILSAAIDTFAKFGFTDATMDDVAAMASVSKQTVYSRFKSKQQLYLELSATILERLNELSQEASEKVNVSSPTFISELSYSLFDLINHPWMRKFFRVVIAESYDFPEQANIALLHLYRHGSKQMITFLDGQAFNYVISKESLSICMNGVLATFMLLRRIYQVTRVPPIDENKLLTCLSATLTLSRADQ